MKNKNFIIKGIKLTAFVISLAVFCASPALATIIELSCLGTNNPSNLIYNSTGIGKTPLDIEKTVQVIQVSVASNAPAPSIAVPDGNGNPKELDAKVVGTFKIGYYNGVKTYTAGNVRQTGIVVPTSPTGEKDYYYYVRAWEGEVGKSKYGNPPSMTKATQISTVYKPLSFATIATVADTTPPAAINSLSALTGINPGEVNLSWTAVGDDGNTGTAAKYIVKYSEAIIDNDTKFNNASTYTQTWTPKAAGQSESYTLSNLTAGKTFYFAIKVQDEVPNTSALSNSPSAKAKESPNTPPAITVGYQNAFDPPTNPAIEKGKYTNKTSVVLRFDFTDPDQGQSFTPKFMYKKIGDAWPVGWTNGAIDGNSAGLTVSNLTDGDYEWKAKINDGFVDSVEFKFGGLDDGKIDFGVDTTAPEIKSSSCTPKTPAIINPNVIEIVFTDQINNSDITNASNFTVKDNSNQSYPIGTPSSHNGDTAVFLTTPNGTDFIFPYGKTITIIVDSSVKDKAGNLIAAGKNTYSFIVKEAPNPEITSISPASPSTIKAYEPLTINGKDFFEKGASSTVYFVSTKAGLNKAAISAGDVNWGASISVSIPSKGAANYLAASDDYHAIVKSKYDKESQPSIQAFIIIPTVYGAEPSSGFADAKILIKGVNFGDSINNISVTIGGKDAPRDLDYKVQHNDVEKWDKIKVTVPQGLAPDQAYTIVVTVNGVPDNNQKPFTVLAPSIASIVPDPASFFKAIEINGGPFSNSEGTVTFKNTLKNTTVSVPDTAVEWENSLIKIPQLKHKFSDYVPAGETEVTVTLPAPYNKSATKTFTIWPTLYGGEAISGPYAGQNKGHAEENIYIKGVGFGKDLQSSDISVKLKKDAQEYNLQNVILNHEDGSNLDKLTVSIPKGIAKGIYQIILTVNSTGINPDLVIPTFEIVEPSASGITPQDAVIFDPITFGGDNFGPDKGTVSLKNNLKNTAVSVPADKVTWGNKEIKFQLENKFANDYVPAGLTTITVTPPGLPPASSDFTIHPTFYGAESIDAPFAGTNKGFAGKTIYLKGTNFGSNLANSEIKVKFKNQADAKEYDLSIAQGADIEHPDASNDKVKVQLPAQLPVGKYNVILTVNNIGQKQGAVVPTFEIVVPGSSGITPQDAVIFDPITFGGDNFGPDKGTVSLKNNLKNTAVSIPADKVTWKNKEIKFQLENKFANDYVPAGLTTITVTPPGLPPASSDFTIHPTFYGAESIDAPFAGTSKGFAGKTIYLKGTNFGSNLANSEIKVKFKNQADAKEYDLSIAQGADIEHPDASNDKVKVQLPADLPVGKYTVILTVNNVGQKQDASIKEFEIVVPHITEVLPKTPDTAKVYDTITIKGSYFGDQKGIVTLRTNPDDQNINVPADKVSPWSESEIKFILPYKVGDIYIGAGPLYVKITTSDGKLCDNVGIFTVRPTVYGADPYQGYAGSETYIKGNAFDNDKTKISITIGGKAAELLSDIEHYSDAQGEGDKVKVKVPAILDPETYTIEVKVNDVPDTDAKQFKVTLEPQPQISTVAPATAKIYDEITITGVNFEKDKATITLNDKLQVPVSAISKWTETEIKFTPLPYKIGESLISAGSTSVKVTTVSGKTSGSKSFTIRPTVYGADPSEGYAGTETTIKGNAFGIDKGKLAITIGGKAAEITGNDIEHSAGQEEWDKIKVKVPADLGPDTYTIEVKVNDVPDTDQKQFKVITQELPKPIISADTPASAFIGQSITVSGENFNKYVNGASKIKFGAVEAKPTSWSPSQIVVAVPANAGSEITVTNSDAQTSAAHAFTVTAGKIVLDDFEGGAVDDWQFDYNTDAKEDSGYYRFDDGIFFDGAVGKDSDINKVAIVSSAKYEGNAGFKVGYSYPDGAEYGGGWGAKLANTFDLSSADLDSVSLYIKWDGSDNQVKFSLKDADGTAYSSTITNATLKALSGYAKVTLSKSSFTYDLDGSDDAANDKFDWTKVNGYNLVYNTKFTTQNYQNIDYITAQKAESVIISDVTIQRSGSDIKVSWKTDPDGAEVDIYTKEGEFSTDAKAWTKAKTTAEKTYTDAGQVGKGSAKYYKIVAKDQALTLTSDVVGKFDLEAKEGFNLVSLPIIPQGSMAINDLIANQLTAGKIFSADGIYNPAGEKAYLSDADNKWYDASTNKLSTMEIKPDAGYFVEVKAGHAKKFITVVGSAASSARSIEIKKGFNLIGTAYPVSVALDSSNLYQSGATPGKIFSADGIYNPAGEKAYLGDADNKWYDASTNKLSAMKLEPGKGYFFERKADKSFTWSYNKPY